MKKRRIFWTGLCASLATGALALGQTAPVAPVAPAAPAPANLWSFLLPSPEQKFACKTAFCNSPLGKLMNGASGPMSAMTGGLLGGRCEKNSIADDMKKKSADEPGGIAARVKNDEEEAKARRAAVRFLGTVDCNYWPEAIDTLKTALRKDRNECVRFEAAMALRNGCCCNNEIIDALKNSILGENKTDPNPPERSERVRAAAAEALARCPMVLEPKKEDKLLTKNPSPNLEPAEYYKKIAQMPREDVAASARAVLVSLQQAGKLTSATVSPANPGAASVTSLPTAAPIPQRPTSVSGIVANAFAPTGPGPRQPFFSNLTKSLTGNQDYGMPTTTKEIIVPAPMGLIPQREPRIVEAPTIARPVDFDDKVIERPLPSRIVPELPPAPRVIDLPVSRMKDEATPFTITLNTPNRIIRGAETVFEIRVTNQSDRPMTSLVLYGWLPEGLIHPAGQEIKAEISTNLAPGTGRTLRIPTHAVKAGRGTVRVKVTTAAGEVSASSEIEVVEPAPVVQQPRPTFSFGAAKDGATSSVPSVPGNPSPTGKAIAPLQIIQSAPPITPPGHSTGGTVGIVTTEVIAPPVPALVPRDR